MKGNDYYNHRPSNTVCLRVCVITYKGSFKYIAPIWLLSLAHFKGSLKGSVNPKIVKNIAHCNFLIKLGGMPPNLFCSCNFFPVSFFLSFFFLTICFFSHMLHWISTKLSQDDQWVSGYKIYQQFDLKGHVGVTGVKKVNHVKNMKTAPNLKTNTVIL